MIPEFDEHGYLPAGVHPATMEEVAERFGGPSELRRVQVESLRWLVDLARRAGVRRIILDGSFVTDVAEPNDVDCVLLIGSEFPLDSAAGLELAVGLPFLGMTLAEPTVFDDYLDVIFATDREFVPKGMIEVLP